jgi:arabinofuranosyltransferase
VRRVLLLLTVLAAGLVLFLARERMIAGGAGLPLDDSWIHLHFARNLAEGRGFAYNPGEPVAGSTAPLWTLALAGAFALFGAGVVVAKSLGVALAAGVGVLTWRLAVAWTGDERLGLLAGALTVSSGPLLWGALSGMEVTLAALLTTAALLCHTRGDVWASGWLLGLATLARPEAILLVPLTWVAGRLSIRRGALLLLPVVVLVAPWVAFNLWTTGGPLPATAAAKIEGGLVAVLGGRPEPLSVMLERSLEFAREWVAWLWSVNAVLPFLLIPGLWTVWTRGGRALAGPALVLVLHPLAMASLAAYRGPAFQEGRYSIHLLPLAFTVGVAALALRGGLGRDAARARWPSRVVGRLVRPALALALLAAGGVALGPAASRYAWAVQNIEAMQVHLGRWVSEHTPPDARLALNDVGAIVYVSRRHAVDVMGLVSPAIISYRRRGEPGVLDYLATACPDYLIVFPTWFPELSRRADYFTPVYRVRLPHNTVAGADEMVVYETVWNRWRRDPRVCGAPAESVDAPGATLPCP